MRRFIQSVALVMFACLLLVALPAAANNSAAKDAVAKVHDAHSAFEALKALDGEWKGTVTLDDGSPARETSVLFEVSAAGHSVIETFGKGKPYEMFSVYHMDGDQLLMTHYCAIGNAPKMKFEPSASAGEMGFAFNGGSNLDPEKDAHAHEGRMKIISADEYASWAVGFSNGKQSNVQHFEMKRVGSSED